MKNIDRKVDVMENLMMILTGGLRILPLSGGLAIFIIVILYFNLRKMGNQFSDCIVRNGIVQEMGVRQPSKTHPYRHLYVICSFSNGNDFLEIPYESGDLKNTQKGDEIPLYFYPNGLVTVVGYDKETTKKKFKQQVIIILILIVVLSFLIPTIGLMAMDRFSNL